MYVNERAGLDDGDAASSQPIPETVSQNLVLTSDACASTVWEFDTGQDIRHARERGPELMTRQQ